MTKRKTVSPKDFAEKQLKEIKEINSIIRKKFRRIILIAFAANLILFLAMFFLIWYLKRPI